MKLNKIINYINQALNYPALAYEDISLFFDQAISELNTTLHTSIPSVSEMIKEFERKMSKLVQSRVRITDAPENNDYSILSYNTTADATAALAIAEPKPKYYFNWETSKFYVYNQISRLYDERDVLEGVYFREEHIPVFYVANILGDDVYWVKDLEDPTLECEIGDYLPEDWCMLWLIPYVCFKYTVRDGGTAQSFSEELTQGFQQLQESYNVPDHIVLATYADKGAYTEVVEKHLPNLNIKVPTRAIYDNMKHSRSVNATYSDFFNRGSFND